MYALSILPLLVMAPCEERVTLAFVGDVILHRSLQRQVAAEGYEDLFSEVKPLLEDAALTFANLEGPIAPGIARDGTPSGYRGSGGFPRFNFPVSLASALKKLGVDVVQTANNHVLDRGWRGVDATLDHVEAAGLVAVGSRRAGTTGNRAAVVEAGGFKVAYFACTFWANGKPDPRYQVQFCHGAGRRRLLREIRAARGSVDAVVVGVHWGIEDADKPGGSQVRFAKTLIDAGADAVIGGHPHVLHRVRYTRGKARAGVVAYSMGNFLSGQLSEAHRRGAVLYLDLVRDAGAARFVNPRLAPTVVQRSRAGRTGRRKRAKLAAGADGPRVNRELIVDNFPKDHENCRESQ